MLTAYQQSRLIPKLRPLQNLVRWQNSNAKNILFKLLQSKPVLESEVELLGTSTINPATIENAVQQLLDIDYFNRVDEWLANIDNAKQLGDIEQLARLVNAKPSRSDVSQYTHVSDTLDDLLKLAANAKNASNTDIVKHPFEQIRAVLGDVSPGSIHVIGGLPGSMKSAYIEQFDLAVSKHFRAGVFSLEMPKAVKLARYAQHLYGDAVGPKAIETGLADTVRLNRAVNELRERKIYIDDKPENIMQLIDAMELMEVEQNPHYYSIDFLQLLSPLPGETDYQSVKNNMKQIYSFAKRHNKPVFVLSQLNRESARDEFNWKGMKVEKLPKMRDLEGAGAIEQVAHSVMFFALDESKPDTRRVYLAKNRNGQAPYDFGYIPIVGDHMNFQFDASAFYL